MRPLHALTSLIALAFLAAPSLAAAQVEWEVGVGVARAFPQVKRRNPAQEPGHEFSAGLMGRRPGSPWGVGMNFGRASFQSGVFIPPGGAVVVVPATYQWATVFAELVAPVRVFAPWVRMGLGFANPAEEGDSSTGMTSAGVGFRTQVGRVRVDLEGNRRSLRDLGSYNNQHVAVGLSIGYRW